MSTISHKEKDNDDTKTDSKEKYGTQNLNDKEKITRHVLGFLTKEKRKKMIEKIRTELGLQEDHSGDKYSKGHHT